MAVFESDCRAFCSDKYTHSRHISNVFSEGDFSKIQLLQILQKLVQCFLQVQFANFIISGIIYCKPEPCFSIIYENDLFNCSIIRMRNVEMIYFMPFSRFVLPFLAFSAILEAGDI